MPSLIDVKVISMNFQSIHAIIYANTNCSTRNTLWKELVDTRLSDIPWLICEDFNVIPKLKDKLGGRCFFNNSSSQGLQNLISSIGFIDLGFSWPPFTRCNNRNGLAKIITRIDNTFATPD